MVLAVTASRIQRFCLETSTKRLWVVNEKKPERWAFSSNCLRYSLVPSEFSSDQASSLLRSIEIVAFSNRAALEIHRRVGCNVHFFKSSLSWTQHDRLLRLRRVRPAFSCLRQQTGLALPDMDITRELQRWLGRIRILPIVISHSKCFYMCLFSSLVVFANYLQRTLKKSSGWYLIFL